jgi:hypothetical protein
MITVPKEATHSRAMPSRLQGTNIPKDMPCRIIAITTLPEHISPLTQGAQQLSGYPLPSPGQAQGVTFSINLPAQRLRCGREGTGGARG